jgi:hypothetical protein
MSQSRAAAPTPSIRWDTADFITRDQIAHLLGVTPRTVQRWQAEEGLPVTRVARSCLYCPQRVRVWLLALEQRNVVQRAA